MLHLKKTKVSIVSYLNTTSFLYGIEKDQDLLEQIELYKDIPSECARKLLEGEVDLGLIPVAVIPQLKEAHIVSDYCIGAIGKVKSVLLLSEVPLHEIESIYLDYQSKTSVNLCKILCSELWKIQTNFLHAHEGYEQNIKGNTAGVIIGDRTFHLDKAYPYQYDLAEEWQKLTSLPFVFAAWVSNKKLDNTFIERFNLALKAGLEQQDQAIAAQKDSSISQEELQEYLSKYIQFDLDAAKQEGMNLFLSKLATQ